MEHIGNIVFAVGDSARTATSTAMGNVNFHPILGRVRFMEAVEGGVIGSPIAGSQVDHGGSHSTCLQWLVEASEAVDFQSAS